MGARINQGGLSFRRWLPHLGVEAHTEAWQRAFDFDRVCQQAAGHVILESTSKHQTAAHGFAIHQGGNRRLSQKETVVMLPV